jgi:tRNA-Thr(GGU) m(6)t(6)A37 methyltransferase TsaA
MTIALIPIGTIRTPFKDLKGMPIQPKGAAGTQGRVVVRSRYQKGLEDLEGFSHIILLYHFHRSTGYRLTVTPYLDDQPHGVFATRAPRRPNPLGFSVVRLLGREKNVLHVLGADVLDRTPLLDLKPYVPQFDAYPDAKNGWLDGKAQAAGQMRADDRFCK